MKRRLKYDSSKRHRDKPHSPLLVIRTFALPKYSASILLELDNTLDWGTILLVPLLSFDLWHIISLSMGPASQFLLPLNIFICCPFVLCTPGRYSRCVSFLPDRKGYYYTG
jgi:hypothetical protein